MEAGTERVSVNGQTQLRGIDYALDSAAGTLTFTRPVPASSAVSVTYTLLPGRSQQSGGGQTIPLSVDLLRNGSGYFSLDALGKADADAPSNLVVGLGLGWNGGESRRLSSRFVYTPPMAGSRRRADRTGLSLTGAASAGHWGQFSLDFSRAGAGLDPSAGSSMEAGRQALTLAGTLSPTKTIQAQLSFSRSDPLTGSSGDGASTDGSRTASSLALTLTPSAQTKITASISETDTPGSGAAQAVALSLDSQATKTLAVSAGFTGQNQPGTGGDSQDVRFQTVLTPSKTYSVQAAAGQSRLGADTTSQQSVTLALTPQPAIRLQAGLSLPPEIRRRLAGHARHVRRHSQRPPAPAALVGAVRQLQKPHSPGHRHESE